MQEQPKNVVETDSESSKNIDTGEVLQSGLSQGGRRPRCPLSLGNGQRPLPNENTCSRSSRRRLLCSYLHASIPTISAGTQPKVFSEENFPVAFYPTFFFHHYDWNRWFASLATTVDNTIKMAERSFKHGRQWCIRRIFLLKPFSNCLRKTWFKFLGSSPSKFWPHIMPVFCMYCCRKKRFLWKKISKWPVTPTFFFVSLFS